MSEPDQRWSGMIERWNEQHHRRGVQIQITVPPRPVGDEVLLTRLQSRAHTTRGRWILWTARGPIPVCKISKEWHVRPQAMGFWMGVGGPDVELLKEWLQKTGLTQLRARTRAELIAAIRSQLARD